MMKTLILVMALATTQLCYAEINVYKSTDNTGINKKEQIEVIEKYLSDLSSQLQKMEAKIDENAAKLKGLETSLVTLKENDLKKLQDQIVPKKEDEKTASQKANEEEMNRLKADITEIKNTDVEQLRVDINALRFSVRNVEKILKVPSK